MQEKCRLCAILCHLSVRPPSRGGNSSKHNSNSTASSLSFRVLNSADVSTYILHLVENSALPKVTFSSTNTAKQKFLSWQVWDAYLRLGDHSKRNNNSNSTYTDGQSSEPSCCRSFSDAPGPYISTKRHLLHRSRRRSPKPLRPQR